MVASTCCEVPTVGWSGLKRTDATRPYSWHGYSGPACYLRILWFLRGEWSPKCRSYTAAARLELSTIRATDEPGTYDARASICTGISSKLHCSAVSLVPMPLVSLIPSSLYPRIGVPMSPLSLILPTPPTTATSYSFYFLLPLISFTDLSYLPPPPPLLLFSTLPLTRYTSY